MDDDDDDDNYYYGCNLTNANDSLCGYAWNIH
jgi:hypothetical protein